MAEEFSEIQGAAKGPVQAFFTELLPLDQRGLIGTLIFFAIILMLGWIGVNEPRRMSTFETQYEARAVMRGAVLFRENCASCHGLNGEGLPGVAPALNYQGMFDGTHMAELGWTGTVHDFVELTVMAGRPQKRDEYAQPMPTWGEEFGGPLRYDQVQDVTAFVMNWGVAFEEGYEGPQVAVTLPTPTPLPYDPVGVDLAAELPAGDPARGEGLVLGTIPGPDGQMLACQGCHSVEGIVMTGPPLNLSAANVPAGSDLEAYVHQSIVDPCSYLSPTFTTCVMPVNFGQRLDAQSLADIIAYIAQLNGQ